VKPFIKKPKFFQFPFKKKTEPLPKSKLPRVHSKELPGKESVKLGSELKRFECPQITFQGGTFPIFISRANACNLYDVDNNRYLDLTSAFGVTGLGHGHPAVLRALREQSKRMMHGLGDVHPNDVKVELAKKLAEITPGNLNQSIFSSTGFEAVESALKTAMMHTKKSGVISFTGAYHGLGYGTLTVTHREDFKKPFLKQMGAFGHVAQFPDERVYEEKATAAAMKSVQSVFKKAKRSKHPVGAVLIEALQGRGGVVPAPTNFMKQLRAFCDEEKVLLIADEVFTGFGRTGTMFACDKSGVVPDILCLGKGLGNGFPISACIAPMRVMFSWGVSTGDSVHTSTFLGNPLGCAVALAVIREIEKHRLVDRSRAMGELFRKELWKLKEKYPIIADIRGAGLMIGLELSEPGHKRPMPATEKARSFVREALRRGIVLLPSGSEHNVIQITPPFIITENEIKYAAHAFDKIFAKL
jgi:4-aminobutyrate aminotransferase / (S)-3-amino-2-methylpropionate transaminase / 5-aminovalerate transaminase